MGKEGWLEYFAQHSMQAFCLLQIWWRLGRGEHLLQDGQQLHSEEFNICMYAHTHTLFYALTAWGTISSKKQRCRYKSVEDHMLFCPRPANVVARS